MLVGESNMTNNELLAKIVKELREMKKLLKDLKQ